MPLDRAQRCLRYVVLNAQRPRVQKNGCAMVVQWNVAMHNRIDGNLLNALRLLCMAATWQKSVVNAWAEKGYKDVINCA